MARFFSDESQAHMEASRASVSGEERHNYNGSVVFVYSYTTIKNTTAYCVEGDIERGVQPNLIPQGATKEWQYKNGIPKDLRIQAAK